MQNLPIQFTQTPPVKNGGADAVSKIDPVSSASNQSFQNMLSKQVQLKQANTKQPVQPPAQQKPAVQSKPVPQQAAPSNTDAATQKKADSKAAEQAKDAEGKPAVADTAEIRSKIASDVDALSAKALGKEKESELSPEGAATAVVDPALAGQLGVPVPVVSTAVGGTPAQTDADAATQKVASPLDTALNNALSQGKGTAADGAAKLEDASPDMKNAKDNTKAENSKLGADNSRWLDSVMANAAKSANADESANTKLAAGTAKDFAVKDIAPVPAYQPVAAANAMQAAQQIGSANVINATPGKTGWDEAISQKVIWMAGSGEQSASLTLNPPDMGPLQVVIHVHNDQADTTFISDNPEVRQALENGLSTLREKMGEAGIQLGQANISSGGQAQQEFQRATQNRTGAQPGQAGEGNQDQPAGTVGSSSTTMRVANGLVDTFA